MTIDDIKVIAKLKKECKFNEIYELYGQKIYKALTPRYARQIDIEKLLSDGRYYELYEKHGERTFYSYIDKIAENDVIYEFGSDAEEILSADAIFYKPFEMELNVLRSQANVRIAILTCIPFLLAYPYFRYAVTYDVNVQKNSIMYEDEINEYNEEIKAYANYIHSLSLSDSEIIVKEIWDMHNNVGYSEVNSLDILGYERLSLYCNNYGVCRHMADDFTARMNAINPDYEAFNLTVYVKDDINFIEYLSNNNITDILSFNDILIGYLDEVIYGNHRVSCMKVNVEGKEVLLVVDATSGSFGILEDGKIQMFSGEQYPIYEAEVTLLGNMRFGTENYHKCIEGMIDSYKTDVDIENVNEHYSQDEQAEILEYIQSNYDTEHYKTQKIKYLVLNSK